MAVNKRAPVVEIDNLTTDELEVLQSYRNLGGDERICLKKNN